MTETENQITAAQIRWLMDRSADDPDMGFWCDQALRGSEVAQKLCKAHIDAYVRESLKRLEGKTDER